MGLNERQKSPGRKWSGEGSVKNLPRSLYALRAALLMLLALSHDGGAEAGSQVFG